MPREQEPSEPADDVTTTDEPEKRGLSQRLRRVRRKPGLEQLGSQDDGAAMHAPRKYGHNRSNTWANTRSQTATLPASLSAPLLLQSIHRHDADKMDAERRRQKLEEQRALWESTLPKALSDHIGFFTTGQHLDYVHPDDMP